MKSVIAILFVATIMTSALAAGERVTMKYDGFLQH